MTASYIEPCRTTLRELVDGGAVETAILATVDGLAITHVGDNSDHADAASAMSASMLALSDALASQLSGTEGEHCRQTVIESRDRTIALIHAGENMVLAVVGRAGLNLGMVLSQARHTAEKIVDIVAKSSDHAEIEAHRAPERASLDELVRRVLQEAAQARGG